jgi:predicted nucleotidyltransferase
MNLEIPSEHYRQIELLKEQIISKYDPEQIFLFGSCARGVVRGKSDIDLCIIKDVPEIRKFKRELMMNLDMEIPVDLIVYTPKSWEKHIGDSGSFAYLIKTKGVQLYGRQ